ncbi:BON domain-containing protein [Gemmata sp. JC673]|uniref:BON domain-containing protein n=1 Tax=Gemmata algarum TaxID=2975278 RepID=A0ABU5F0A2_9BACT|nr:BON domain-containing protein [Gemmata algarum]MDY3560991.1 BON domain-containing protein [Gemmata algarum]
MNTCPSLAPDLADFFLHSPIGQLRRLVVIENETEVLITGQVSSYYHKQLAQEHLRRSLGQRIIVNHVEVCPGDIG